MPLKSKADKSENSLISAQSAKLKSGQFICYQTGQVYLLLTRDNIGLTSMLILYTIREHNKIRKIKMYTNSFSDLKPHWEKIVNIMIQGRLDQHLYHFTHSKNNSEILDQLIKEVKNLMPQVLGSKENKSLTAFVTKFVSYNEAWFVQYILSSKPTTLQSMRGIDSPLIELVSLYSKEHKLNNPRMQKQNDQQLEALISIFEKYGLKDPVQKLMSLMKSSSMTFFLISFFVCLLFSFLFYSFFIFGSNKPNLSITEKMFGFILFCMLSFLSLPEIGSRLFKKQRECLNAPKFYFELKNMLLPFREALENEIFFYLEKLYTISLKDNKAPTQDKSHESPPLFFPPVLSSHNIGTLASIETTANTFYPPGGFRAQYPRNKPNNSLSSLCFLSKPLPANNFLNIEWNIDNDNQSAAAACPIKVEYTYGELEPSVFELYAISPEKGHFIWWDRHYLARQYPGNEYSRILSIFRNLVIGGHVQSSTAQQGIVYCGNETGGRYIYKVKNLGGNGVGAYRLFCRKVATTTVHGITRCLYKAELLEKTHS